MSNITNAHSILNNPSSSHSWNNYSLKKSKPFRGFSDPKVAPKPPALKDRNLLIKPDNNIDQITQSLTNMKMS